MRGKRKPTALIILECEPNKKRIKKNEPKPKRFYQHPPSDLSDVAKLKWKELAPKLYNLGLLTELDFDALRSLCMMYAKYIAAEDAATLGVIRTNSGYVTQNPMINVSLMYFEKYHRLLSDFGMTPSSRSKIDSQFVGGRPLEENPSNEIEDLLNGPRLVEK